MSVQFSSSVEYGLKLSKRIYYGKGSVSAPAMVRSMSRSSSSSLESTYLPTAVMVYAVVNEPAVVDNPDVPSYQPYVHGTCDPPALIPLHMYKVAMEIDCCLDTAFATVSGAWRLHCVMASRKCDCRIAIPMGEQGSILGVEVNVAGKSYHSQLITMEDAKKLEKVTKAEDGRFLNGSIYILKVPQVDGGSTLSIKLSWSQKLIYHDSQFSLSVPFSFPAYVIPVGKKISKREKILLNVNLVTGTEVLCESSSHPLKELRREDGKIGCLYEAEVPRWSRDDFNFSYTFSSNDLFGGVLLQSPSLHDLDQRGMFCLYLFPGNNRSMKLFRKEVVFVIDISGSMRGDPLDSVKNGLLASLSKLDRRDSFNIIAFNGEVYLFSSSMELATEEVISNAIQWINANFIANGDTNILLPLKQALKLLAKSSDSVPLIFLITDGAVEDEREICNVMKDYVASGRSICPRISTFGVGSYCNHYFLQMLAQIGRGHYDAAYAADSIDCRMQRLFTIGSSVILANISTDALDNLDSLELHQGYIPDLKSESPLIVSGRYDGDFPDSVKIIGMLADTSDFVIDLKEKKAKGVPLDRVLARRQIDTLTSRAWLLKSKELEEKVEKMSTRTGVPSEYTRLFLLQADTWKNASESALNQEVHNKIVPQKAMELKDQKIIFLGSLGVGFGDITATAENTPPGYKEEAKPLDPTEKLVKAASNCCSKLLNRCCCMCFIRTCSHINDQCATIFAQLCTALACFQCLSCCCDLCSCLDL